MQKLILKNNYLKIIKKNKNLTKKIKNRENNMKIKEKINSEIQFLKKDSDKNFAWSLIFACVILFCYCYFGSFSFFEKTFSGMTDLDYWKIIYHNTMSFVLFFVFGTIFTKLVIKEKLSNFGLCAGEFKLGFKLCLIALPICAICGLLSSVDSGMSSTYPLINFREFSAWWQIALYFLSYFLYYVGWEYLFRGMLCLCSQKKCGALCAILLSTLVSALIHTSIAGFGKPLIETLSAIPAGLIFGYITLKTKSINYSLIIHFMVGVFTDIFVFLLV